MIRVVLFLFFSCIGSAALAQNLPKTDSSGINPDSVYLDEYKRAEYTVGDAARIRFFEYNINAGVPFYNGAPAGKYVPVIVCIIDRDGKMISAVAETNFGYGLEAEVIRVIRKLPEPYWPAIKNGVPVKSRIRFPMTFSVSN